MSTIAKVVAVVVVAAVSGGAVKFAEWQRTAPSPSPSSVAVATDAPARPAPLPVALAVALDDSPLEPLDIQYSRAIERHYLPAKHAAELGTGSWYRAYEVARIISLSCALRASWNDVQVSQSSPEPEQLPGMPVDWRKKSVAAARELTSCIQIVRSEER